MSAYFLLDPFEFPYYFIVLGGGIERIQKKICRHKMSIMFNEICINEEMLPKYTHTHTHIYIYIYIYKPHLRTSRMRHKVNF